MPEPIYLQAIMPKTIELHFDALYRIMSYLNSPELIAMIFASKYSRIIAFELLLKQAFTKDKKAKRFLLNELMSKSSAAILPYVNLLKVQEFLDTLIDGHHPKHEKGMASIIKLRLVHQGVWPLSPANYQYTKNILLSLYMDQDYQIFGGAGLAEFLDKEESDKIWSTLNKKADLGLYHGKSGFLSIYSQKIMMWESVKWTEREWLVALPYVFSIMPTEKKQSFSINIIKKITHSLQSDYDNNECNSLSSIANDTIDILLYTPIRSWIIERQGYYGYRRIEEDFCDALGIIKPFENADKEELALVLNMILWKERENRETYLHSLLANSLIQRLKTIKLIRLSHPYYKSVVYHLSRFIRVYFFCINNCNNLIQQSFFENLNPIIDQLSEHGFLSMIFLIVRLCQNYNFDKEGTQIMERLLNYKPIVERMLIHCKNSYNPYLPSHKPPFLSKDNLEKHFIQPFNEIEESLYLIQPFNKIEESLNRILKLKLYQGLLPYLPKENKVNALFFILDCIENDTFKDLDIKSPIYTLYSEIYKRCEEAWAMFPDFPSVLINYAINSPINNEEVLPEDFVLAFKDHFSEEQVLHFIEQTMDRKCLNYTKINSIANFYKLKEFRSLTTDFLFSLIKLNSTRLAQPDYSDIARHYSSLTPYLKRSFLKNCVNRDMLFINSTDLQVDYLSFILTGNKQLSDDSAFLIRNYPLTTQYQEKILSILLKSHSQPKDKSFNHSHRQDKLQQAISILIKSHEPDTYSTAQKTALMNWMKGDATDIMDSFKTPFRDNRSRVLIDELSCQYQLCRTLCAQIWDLPFDAELSENLKKTVWKNEADAEWYCSFLKLPLILHDRIHAKTFKEALETCLLPFLKNQLLHFRRTKPMSLKNVSRTCCTFNATAMP